MGLNRRPAKTNPSRRSFEDSGLLRSSSKSDASESSVHGAPLRIHRKQKFAKIYPKTRLNHQTTGSKFNAIAKKHLLHVKNQFKDSLKLKQLEGKRAYREIAKRGHIEPFVQTFRIGQQKIWYSKESLPKNQTEHEEESGDVCNKISMKIFTAEKMRSIKIVLDSVLHEKKLVKLRGYIQFDDIKSISIEEVNHVTTMHVKTRNPTLFEFGRMERDERGDIKLVWTEGVKLRWQNETFNPEPESHFFVFKSQSWKPEYKSKICAYDPRIERMLNQSVKEKIFKTSPATASPVRVSKKSNINKEKDKDQDDSSSNTQSKDRKRISSTSSHIEITGKKKKEDKHQADKFKVDWTTLKSGGDKKEVGVKEISANLKNISNDKNSHKKDEIKVKVNKMKLINDEHKKAKKENKIEDCKIDEMESTKSEKKKEIKQHVDQDDKKKKINNTESIDKKKENQTEKKERINKKSKPIRK